MNDLSNKTTIVQLCQRCLCNQSSESTIVSTIRYKDIPCDACQIPSLVTRVRLNGPLVKVDAMDRMKQTTHDSRTGTQNRPYTSETLMVRATLTVRGIPSVWEFNWNDRESVRRFAADSDRCIRAGGTTTLEPVKGKTEACASCHGRCVEDAFAVGDGEGGPCRACKGSGVTEG